MIMMGNLSRFSIWQPSLRIALVHVYSLETHLLKTDMTTNYSRFLVTVWIVGPSAETNYNKITFVPYQNCINNLVVEISISYNEVVKVQRPIFTICFCICGKKFKKNIRNQNGKVVDADDTGGSGPTLAIAKDCTGVCIQLGDISIYYTILDNKLVGPDYMEQIC